LRIGAGDGGERLTNRGACAGRCLVRSVARPGAREPGVRCGAFDLLELDGKDPGDLPLEWRKERLKALLKRSPFGLALNDYVSGDAPARFAHVLMDIVNLIGAYQPVCGTLNAFAIPAPEIGVRRISLEIGASSQDDLSSQRRLLMSTHLQSRLTIAAQFPQHYFLENIAVRGDGSMLITVVQPKTLYYVPPPRSGVATEPLLLHSFDENVTGIAELEPDVFAVFTTNAYTTHENYMHRLDLRGWTPGERVNLELSLTFPKEALALNGCCALSNKTILIADSLAGQIWRVDIGPDGGSQATVWLKHESMKYVQVELPPPPQPGINGVRYSANGRWLYYTTTGQKLFMRVRVDPATFEPSGEPELVAHGGMYDDFCIDDERGVA
jgi:hypothetical protein